MYGTERRWTPLTLVLAVAGGLVLGGIALSVLSAVAGLVWFLIRMAVIIGLACAAVAGVRYVLTSGSRRALDR